MRRVLLASAGVLLAAFNPEPASKSRAAAKQGRRPRSRYIDVPVTIVTRTKSGRTERFEGTYTLRRSIVDGATAAQRRWSIYRAKIREVTAGSLPA